MVYYTRGVPGTLTTFFYHVFPFMQHVPTGPNLLAAAREHDRIPSPSADADTDSDALPQGKYFYHPRPPSATTSMIPNYPIVTDFVAWQFPEKILDHWVRPKPSPEEMAELWRKYAGCRQKDMEVRRDG